MKRKYLLSPTGRDYKANMHCHTTLSDGSFSPEEIKAQYMEKGYQIVAYTDHDVFVPHNDLCDENFVALNGFEMEFYDNAKTRDFQIMRTTHLNMVALDPTIAIQPYFHRSDYFIGRGAQNKHLVKFDETLPDFVREYTPECVNAVMRGCREKGFFVTYNHPRWSLENYEVYSKYDGMNAIELINGSSINEGFVEHNYQVFDDLLLQGKHIGAIGGDDNHSMNDAFLSYTAIRAESLTYEAVAAALQTGNYYASEGPEIKSIYVEDGRLFIETSAAKSIVFTTGIRRALKVWNRNGSAVKKGVFDLTEKDRYVRMTVTGLDGSMAYSNAYFVE